MYAHFEVYGYGDAPTSPDEKRTLTVTGVRDARHAEELLARIKAVHSHKVRLLSLEDYWLQYTATEIEREKNLLGGVRRFSTGNCTVTIPEGQKQFRCALGHECLFASILFHPRS